MILTDSHVTAHLVILGMDLRNSATLSQRWSLLSREANMTVFLEWVVMSMADGRAGGWWIFSTVTTSLRGRTTHTSPSICRIHTHTQDNKLCMYRSQKRKSRKIGRERNQEREGGRREGGRERERD